MTWLVIAVIPIGAGVGIAQAVSAHRRLEPTERRGFKAKLSLLILGGVGAVGSATRPRPIPTTCSVARWIDTAGTALTRALSYAVARIT
jgi:hypothetical protein